MTENAVSWIISKELEMVRAGWKFSRHEIMLLTQGTNLAVPKQCVKNHQQIPRPCFRHSKSMILAGPQEPASLTSTGVVWMKKLEHCIWRNPFTKPPTRFHSPRRPQLPGAASAIAGHFNHGVKFRSLLFILII